MRQTLELRLAVAENERKSAVQERLEKEKSSLKALADQEIIMEKVVQESNILNQEAEENAKVMTSFLYLYTSITLHAVGWHLQRRGYRI